MKPIEHLSDEQPQEFSAAVKAAENLEALRLVLKEWQPIAADAYELAVKMTEAEWPEYQRGKFAEASGVYGGDEWYDKYSPILFPDLMFKVSMLAEQFKVPWGLMFNRLAEMGKITLNKEGIYSFPDRV